MDKIYATKMLEIGYDQLVCDIFGNWENVKDELLLSDRKQGSGNGTVHVFLGAADVILRKEFSSYYASVNNGEDPSIGAINVKHYFIASNIISMLGHTCQYLYAKEQEIETNVTKILGYISNAKIEDGLLCTNSLFKLSIGSNKLRPYFKQFENNGVFTKLVRQLLLPSSSYKISLYKNTDGEYAAFWLLGFNWLSDFEADSDSNHLTRIVDKNKEKHPLQQIFYGAPGTGKSNRIEEDTNESNRIRATFHPDYDYATFVGAYKPTVKQVNKYGMWGKVITHDDNTPVQEDVIVYKFIPQAFIKAYVEAWRRYADTECTDKDFFLVIEEINRGNCAQIFGDLFQLLDRTNAGFSSYAVETESDLQNFLTTDEEYKLDIALTEDIKNDNGKVIATAANVKNGKVLVLPPNLHIWATMNTSDQSLFPIDSAFKRRWDWTYMPIKYENDGWKVMLGNEEVCKWTDLQQTLNNLIYDATESEDKMLGDWFVKANGNEINEEQLVGKIIFYLWNDVAKVDAGRLFDLEVEKNGRKRKVVFSDFYKIDGNVNLDITKEWLKNINVLKDKTTEDENQNDPEQ